VSHGFLQLPQIPVVRVIEAPDLDQDQVPGLLKEINNRQWLAYREVLLEAKFKAESMLRNDAVMKDHGLVTFYNGWVAYADYVIGSLEAIRNQTSPNITQQHPGPE